jgi:hypothetical protein
MKHDERHGDRIALMFEEQGEILRFDITELNVHEGISTKPVPCDKGHVARSAIREWSDWDERHGRYSRAGWRSRMREQPRYKFQQKVTKEAKALSLC